MTIQSNFIKLSLCLFLLTGTGISLPGCKKLVDPGTPPNRITSAKVYSTDSLAVEAVNGIYSEIAGSFGPLNGYTTWLCGIYSDELGQPVIDNKYEPFLTNDLQPDDQTIQLIWTKLYKYVYQCNDVIEGLDRSKSINNNLRDQLSGEALFLRALNYFYLVNLFGDVPLITGTDYTINANIGRIPVEQIYDQMISDLLEAQKRLPVIYFTINNLWERVRANQLSATALLARVYLYKKDWAAAENAATQVIQSFYYILETDPHTTFLSTSREAILQFMPFTFFNTAEGATFIPQGRLLPVFKLQDALIASFEPGDKRRAWVNRIFLNGTTYYYPYKYQRSDGAPYTEYNVLLRFAEQYLIRAEALIRQNKLDAATDDLNTIRARAGLPAKAVYSSQPAAMIALEQERRIELFAEWGHRWFDLKRWPALNPLPGVLTRADEVLGSFKTEWKQNAYLWPIPAKEIGLNTSLTQNNGY